MTIYTTAFTEQLGDSDEDIVATFEYCADFNGDGYDDVKVTLSLAGANNSGTEDIIGAAFDIQGDAIPAGLTITNILRSTSFGSLSTYGSTFVIGANQVSDAGPLDPGFNTSGGGSDEPYDVGIKVSEPGSGEGIVQSFSFVLSAPLTDLDGELLLENTDWYVRLQSTDGGAGSAKTAGYLLDLPPCFIPFDIFGTKYLDKTGNGISADDGRLAGVTIFIDLNSNGTFDIATDLSTQTAADGTWSLLDLGENALGKTVYEVLPSGYTQTVGNAGYVLPNEGGQDQYCLDFANFDLFDIYGTKYLDKTGNGISADDGRLAGVTIFIDLNSNGTFDALTDLSTQTAADGTWSFANLGANVLGKTVYEVVPAGYTQSVGNAGYVLPSEGGHDQYCLDFANYYNENGTAQTPGFWKNWPAKFNQETVDEFTAAGLPNLTISTAGGYETYFGVNALGSRTVSFLEALSANGGGENAFLRASAAAFANASTNELNYQIDEVQITSFGGAAAAGYINTLNLIDTDDDDHIEVSEIRALVSDIYTAGGAWNPTNFTLVASALDAMNNMNHLDSSLIIA